MLLNIYNRLPVRFIYGKGCYLYDHDRRAYLDGVSGVAVCCLGHAHPEIAKTICDQSKKLLHVSNLVQIPEQEKLAEQLLNISGLSAVFFGNSGSEANETAIKIARSWAHRHGYHQPKTLCFQRSFHGRTLAMVAASNNPNHTVGFDPLPTGFVSCDTKDIVQIDRILSADSSISSIFIEPIQGEAGVIFHPENFLVELQELAHKHDCLFILDEVQTGAGRTGRYFNYLYNDALKPDIVTIAKGMANGIPVSACLVAQKVSEVMQPGSHGSTFGGNPLACAVASKVIEILERDDVYQNIIEVGKYLLDSIRSRIGDHPRIRRIQGLGGMIGIEFREIPSFCIARQLLKADKLIIAVSGKKTIRLLPPLILEYSQADSITQAVCRLVENEALF